MRGRSLTRLQQIDDELLGMGRRVEHALGAAMHALVTWDTRMTQRVIPSDYGIDEAGATIEQIALELQATQPPLRASDLRTLHATLAVAHELERTGDYAQRLARQIDRCLQAPALFDPPFELYRLGIRVQAMLYTSLEAFDRCDVVLARSLAAADARVDALEDQVIAELICAARQDMTRLECAVDLIEVAHLLGRLADGTTTIAERVVLVATNATSI
jgi:phosphate transport system protein